MLRIGMLTSGGDCQALNAAMRGVYKSVTQNAGEPVEFYGFEDGYRGMIYSNFRLLSEDDFQNILTVFLVCADAQLAHLNYRHAKTRLS